MAIAPYLNFKGQCAEAFMFYTETFGGTIVFSQTFKESPMKDQVPPEGFGISIELPTADQARRVFDALAKSGSVTMPFDKTFWSEGFGMTTDRFGIPWMVGVQMATA